jgi:glutamyl/glutaminyl-tRNA synthetase
VGEFQTQGFLAPAMVNFLALLGWNDGTEQEVFSVGVSMHQHLCRHHRQQAR